MIYERIVDMICDQFHVDKEDIIMETSFRDDLNADSLDLVELIMTMEDEFGLEVDDDVVEKIGTVGEAVNYIKTIIN